jgi:hypothetical protein
MENQPSGSNMMQERPVSIAHSIIEPEPPHNEIMQSPKQDEPTTATLPRSVKVPTIQPLALGGFSWGLRGS